MKKLAILSLVLLLAAFILLPSTGNGKYNVSKPVVADGYPVPPFPPGSGSAAGSPAASSATLIADGYPVPPFPPKPPAAYLNTLVADGDPMPPFPPKPLRGLAV